ncbi:uncharacterized protein RHOBADRAFT_44546 [Rhodotorula graminis WP1]|uniref:Uncharacterized protein n=1 Tax=Rhodotorula graminis (strain WP1) TaxID=578459 RepID=A0A194S6J0_RHOGW|nr:uncharacterized protein RHOBADRAFT_44546 [Rhodotorula graminis WP1]KPV75031.1 hypothetical protein RHOBADRAFT_44546 [Rhodotorula graminis WP1]
MSDPFSAFTVGSSFPGWDGGYSFFKSVEEEALEDHFTFVPTWDILYEEDAPDTYIDTYTIECDYYAAVASVVGALTSDRSCPYSIQVQQTSAGSTAARVIASHLEHDHALDLPEDVVETCMSPYALWRKWTEKDARPSILHGASSAIWYARRTFNGLKGFHVEMRKRAIEDQDRVVADVKRFFPGEQARELLDESHAGKWLFTDDERKLVQGPLAVGPAPSHRKKIAPPSVLERTPGAPSPSPSREVKTSATTTATTTTTTSMSISKRLDVADQQNRRLPLAQVAPEPFTPAAARKAPAPAPPSTASSSTSALQLAPLQEAPVALKKPVEMIDLVDSDDEDVKPVVQPEPESATAAVSSLGAGASLHTLLSSLSSTFDFAKHLEHFLHPDVDVDSAAQLLEIARSPKLLDTLLDGLAAQKKVDGSTDEVLRGVPLVWRTALRQALEEKVRGDKERP